MGLEPQVQVFLDMMAANASDVATITPEEMRGQFALMGAMPGAPEMPTSDSSLPGPAGPIPVRIYSPSGSTPDGPTIVFYHGGGWVIGDLESHDVACRRLAAATGMRLIAVDYRLAPEHPYPAAAEDAHAALVAVTGGALGGPPSWVAVAGDSAGGNLSAVVSLMARDRGTRVPDFQLLIYPATDFGGEYPSRHENATGYMLTSEMMEWFANHYVTEAQVTEPYASPALAGSHAGLPPAHVVTAEFDPLRDEGEAYAKILAGAGVPATSTRYDGQIHGFFGLPELFGPSGQKVVDDVAEILRSAAG